MVLDVDTAEHYGASGGNEAVALGLANIQTEQDILDFVARWGLLWLGVGADTAGFREPLSGWHKATVVLNLFLKFGILIRRAGDPDDPDPADSMRQLRDYFTHHVPGALGGAPFEVAVEELSDDELLNGTRI